MNGERFRLRPARSQDGGHVAKRDDDHHSDENGATYANSVVHIMYLL